MPELTNKNESVEFWSTADVSYDQLQKFWKGVPQQGRREVLRVDKQTFFEQARKIMFCSRCHGFLVKEFSQIVMYGKPSQQDGAVAHLSCNRLGISKSQIVGGLSDVAGCQSDDQDPSIHPWGCLTTTRDGTLTLLDCYLSSTSLKGIQNVFDNARTRERERKLLYPSACGVEGRRWKGPGSRETCSVHNVRPSLEKLVDFWSSQGKESRQSLLKMKEEDFVEQLTFRLDDKKFCINCRRNVVREFKELKELKSIRKESDFQYEISHDTVQADWSHTFIDTYGKYRHFEWAIGREKGKSDILAFKNVGLSKIVQVNGLDLSGLDACYITLRAWKTDGDCTEFSVKAHTSRGEQYVHCRLVVGDGFVTLTEGESIMNFFKHAEEVVKEENILVDENGNRLNGECSHSQKHARSPKLARKFLLDAATLFFKEQVEKAFRERRARRNAHSVFVSLALKMIEERAHVACKEILTLDNQIKLLEEEVKEKNEEEERKERRRIKEREKKFRRKERTKENVKHKDNCSFTKQHLALEVKIEESKIVDEELDAIETGKIMSPRPVSPHMQDEQRINGYMRKNTHVSSDISPDENIASSNDQNASSGSDQLKYSGLKLQNRYQQDTISKCSINKQVTVVVPTSGIMVNKSEQSYHDDHFDTSSRTTSRRNKLSRSAKSNIRAGDMSKPSHFGNKFTRGNFIYNTCGRSKPNAVAGNITSSRYSPQTKQVREPTKLQMKYIRSHSESNVKVRSSTLSDDAMEPCKPLEPSGALCYDVGGQKTVGIKDRDDVKKELKLCKPGMGNIDHSGFHLKEKTCQHSKEVADVCSYLTGTRNPSISSTSSSDSCSSCLSKGNNSRPSSNPQIIEPLSTLNSEDASQKSEGREASRRQQIEVHKYEDVVMDKNESAKGGEPIRSCSLDRSRMHTAAEVSIENGNGHPDVSHMYLQAQCIPEKQDPTQKQPNAAGEKYMNSDISQAEDKGFSYFHFGGPFALADAYKTDILPSEDAVGGISPVKFIHHKGDLISNKRDSIKEYNLFASNKGIAFSIF